MKKGNSKIIPINWIDKTSRSAIVPGHVKDKQIRRLKEIKKTKGNCYFTTGVAHSLIDFIYRAVVKLDFKDKNLIFSRGAVKKNNVSIVNAVGILELDWDVGISIRIPHKLRYNNKIILLVDDEKHQIRLMEIIVLSGLLHIVYPGKNSLWCSNMAVTIIIKGWEQLDSETPANVCSV